MNNMQTFNHAMFGEIEVVVIDGKEHFGGTQVAMLLGYTNPHKAINDHCRKDGLTKREVIDKLGRVQEMNFISEGNLFRLITRSKLPGAEEFEKWVFDEVLPAIRKHGGYLTPEKVEEALLNPDTLIRLATELKNERAERVKLQEKSDADRPKVIFAEALETSNTTILIGELAKLLKQNGIDIGQNRLFDLLRSQGYLGNRGEYRNIPTQKAMELKLFELKTRTINNPDGSVRVTRTTKVTGKGQIYFINKLKPELVAT
jgi:anti-repressor protein